MRRWLLSLLPPMAGVLASAAGHAAPCEIGLETLTPGELIVGVRGESLPNNSAEHIPFAAIAVTSQHGVGISIQGEGISSTGIVGAAECFARAGDEIALADAVTVPAVAALAEFEARILDGALDLRSFAAMTSTAVLEQNAIAALADVELGFREVFDVTSGELGMQTLQIDWSLAGNWTQIGCSAGEFHDPPARELRLKVFSQGAVGGAQEVADLYFVNENLFEFDRVDGVQVHPNSTVFVDVWFRVYAHIGPQTVFGDPPQLCIGGDSNGDFYGIDEGLSIAFHNPSPDTVTIAPRSGIAYSATVPEPGAAALGGAAIGALGGLFRGARRR